MRAPRRFVELFRRHDLNPILTAADWPYPAHTVFNPGATRLADGTTLLLCRVEDRRGHSHLCAARSTNGVNGWVVDETPTFEPQPHEHSEELWGVEDPRITFVPELGKYAVAYTAFSRDGPGVALALTEDFERFERCGLVHRPATETAAHIWISYSPDLSNWGHHKLMLAARKGAWWDAYKVGLSPPLIETERGWLMIYHGVRHTASGALYRLGLALFALDSPERCLLRGAPWVFGPETAYERNGDVPNVTFPCGYTLASDNDTLNLYYGAADTCIALATASIGELLAWLDEHGSKPQG